MNIFGGGLKRQFIARPDASKNQIVFKWPDVSIPMAAQLTVEPDEVALFVREGKVVGVQQPGLVTLEGKNIPFLDVLIDAGFLIRGRNHRIPKTGVTVTFVAEDAGGATGITDDDWFVTEDLDDTTLVLFAVARSPRSHAA